MEHIVGDGVGMHALGFHVGLHGSCVAAISSSCARTAASRRRFGGSSEAILRRNRPAFVSRVRAVLPMPPGRIVVMVRSCGLPIHWKRTRKRGGTPFCVMPSRFHEPCRTGQIRRAKGGLNSELRAVCDGALRRAADLTAFVLSLREHLSRAESFGLVPLLGVRRACTGVRRSRSALFRWRSHPSGKVTGRRAQP